MDLAPALVAFLTAPDPAAAQALLAAHADELLTAETLAALAAHVAAAPAAEQEALQARLLLLQDELHFAQFMAVPDRAALTLLAAQLDDPALDRLEQTASARLAAAAGDGENTAADSIRQRLDGLHGLRTDGADELAQARAALAEWASLDDDERLWRAFQATSGPADMMRLVGQTADDALARLAETAAARVAAAAGDGDDADAEGSRQRLDELRRWRAAVEDARTTLAPLGEDGEQALVGRLVEWIRQPSWDESQSFLHAHAGELLTDVGAAALFLLRMANAGNDEVELHANLLAACWEQGIDPAYAQLRAELAAGGQAAAENPLRQAIGAWLAVDDEAAVRQVLDEHAAVLVTAEARDQLAQLAAEAGAQGHAAAQRRFAARQALLDDALRGRGRPAPPSSVSSSRSSPRLPPQELAVLVRIHLGEDPPPLRWARTTRTPCSSSSAGPSARAGSPTSGAGGEPGNPQLRVFAQQAGLLWRRGGGCLRSPPAPSAAT